MSSIISDSVQEILNKSAREYSPLALAYIGDSVLEVFVRTLLLSKGNRPVHRLHTEASSLVCAKAQSVMAGYIEDKLSEAELSVYKRGRNAKSSTVPKNADLSDYRRGTGFEALIGFLYITGQEERINEILTFCIGEYLNQE